MSGPRIVPPDEAREWEHEASLPLRSRSAEEDDAFRDLAHTAAVLGEQRDAALALHRPSTDHDPHRDPFCVGCALTLSRWEVSGSYLAPTYPCPTARAFGVTE